MWSLRTEAYRNETHKGFWQVGDSVARLLSGGGDFGLHLHADPGGAHRRRAGGGHADAHHHRGDGDAGAADVTSTAAPATATSTVAPPARTATVGAAYGDAD